MGWGSVRALALSGVSLGHGYLVTGGSSDGAGENRVYAHALQCCSLWPLDRRVAFEMFSCASCARV